MRPSGPSAFGTLISPTSVGPAAADACWAAIAGGTADPPGAASVPKRIESNFRWSVGLSKSTIVIDPATVTSEPFSTFASFTAAQVSPEAVFSRRYV